MLLNNLTEAFSLLVLGVGRLVIHSFLNQNTKTSISVSSSIDISKFEYVLCNQICLFETYILHLPEGVFRIPLALVDCIVRPVAQFLLFCNIPQYTVHHAIHYPKFNYNITPIALEVSLRQE